LRHRKFSNDDEPQRLVKEVFRALPPGCQSIRPAYAALRYQSAVRNALKTRRWRDAGRYWLASFGHDALQALRPRLLRKALRAMFQGSARP
jgi:hypothetical protein